MHQGLRGTDMLKSPRHLAGATSALLALHLPATLWAQDITPNAAQGFGTVVNSNRSRHYTITGGTVSGLKVLHGFETFNIPARGGATFDGRDTKTKIDSIFGIMSTGRSDLRGPLKIINFNQEYGKSTPTLYLVNPNGIVLGKGFKTNVRALSLSAVDGILLGCSASLSGCDGAGQYQLLSVDTRKEDLLANTKWQESNFDSGWLIDSLNKKLILVKANSLSVDSLALLGAYVAIHPNANLILKRLVTIAQWFPGAWDTSKDFYGIGNFTRANPASPSAPSGSSGKFEFDQTPSLIRGMDNNKWILKSPTAIFDPQFRNQISPGSAWIGGFIRPSNNSLPYQHTNTNNTPVILAPDQAIATVVARQGHVYPAASPKGYTSPFSPNARVLAHANIKSSGKYYGFISDIYIDPVLFPDLYIKDLYPGFDQQFDQWKSQRPGTKSLLSREGDGSFSIKNSRNYQNSVNPPLSVVVQAPQAAINFFSGEQLATSQAASVLGLKTVEALTLKRSQQILQQAIDAVQTPQLAEKSAAEDWSEPAALLVSNPTDTVTAGLLPQKFNRANYNPAILQLRFTEAQGRTTQADTDAFLDLTLIPASGTIVGRRVEVSFTSFASQLKELYGQLSRQEDLGVTNVNAAARRLYDVLIGPLRAELDRQKITTLLIGADRGLQAVPYAALHSGQDFVGERFAFALTPSISLSNLIPAIAGEKRLLAAGASQFDGLAPLPLVPQELEAISGSEPSDVVVNTSFTRATIEHTAADPRYHRIHLATHAEFLPGGPSKSVLYSGTGPMSLETLVNLRKRRRGRPLDLIVLSACRTALGDRDTELGFAGLALQAGSRSAIGTLWYVDDVATSAYFIQAYHYMAQGLPKAEALQFTRRDFANGRVLLSADQIIASDGRVLLSGLTKVQQRRASNGLSNPFYWSGIELLGSPW